MEHETIELVDVQQATDHALIANLQRLVRADRALSARLLVHMGEVDARGLYRERAHSSMFSYCVEELRMSEAEAYLRIQAARLGRQFPLVLQLFSQGLLHLSAIKLLGPHLTLDNHEQLLERASGKNKREVEMLVATIAPKADAPSMMRKLPEARPSRLMHAVASTPSAIPATAAARPAPSPSPLSPGRFKVQFTAGQELHDKLAQLKDLLRHQVPDGDLASIVELAVDLLIDKTRKQRFAQTSRKTQRRVQRRKQNSRYVPRAVVREVHERDAGQCTFVSSHGKRCGARGFLEIHHCVPFARGGEASAENLKLVCRAHNALFAERDFGAKFMRSKLREALHTSGLGSGEPE